MESTPFAYDPSYLSQQGSYDPMYGYLTNQKAFGAPSYGFFGADNMNLMNTPFHANYDIFSNSAYQTFLTQGFRTQTLSLNPILPIYRLPHGLNANRFQEADFGSKFHTLSTIGSTMVEMGAGYAGMKFGASLGSSLGPVGSFVGGVAGSIGGAAVGTIYSGVLDQMSARTIENMEMLSMLNPNQNVFGTNQGYGISKAAQITTLSNKLAAKDGDFNTAEIQNMFTHSIHSGLIDDSSSFDGVKQQLKKMKQMTESLVSIFGSNDMQEITQNLRKLKLTSMGSSSELMGWSISVGVASAGKGMKSTDYVSDLVARTKVEREYGISDTNSMAKNLLFDTAIGTVGKIFKDMFPNLSNKDRGEKIKQKFNEINKWTEMHTDELNGMGAASWSQEEMATIALGMEHYNSKHGTNYKWFNLLQDRKLMKKVVEEGIEQRKHDKRNAVNILMSSHDQAIRTMAYDSNARMEAINSVELSKEESQAILGNYVKNPKLLKAVDNLRKIGESGASEAEAFFQKFGENYDKIRSKSAENETQEWKVAERLRFQAKNNLQSTITAMFAKLKSPATKWNQAIADLTELGKKVKQDNQTYDSNEITQVFSILNQTKDLEKNTKLTPMSINKFGFDTKKGFTIDERKDYMFEGAEFNAKFTNYVKNLSKENSIGGYVASFVQKLNPFSDNYGDDNAIRIGDLLGKHSIYYDGEKGRALTRALVTASQAHTIGTNKLVNKIENAKNIKELNDVFNNFNVGATDIISENKYGFSSQKTDKTDEFKELTKSILEENGGIEEDGTLTTKGKNILKTLSVSNFTAAGLLRATGFKGDISVDKLKDFISEAQNNDEIKNILAEKVSSQTGMSSEQALKVVDKTLGQYGTKVSDSMLEKEVIDNNMLDVVDITKEFNGKDLANFEKIGGLKDLSELMQETGGDARKVFKNISSLVIGSEEAKSDIAKQLMGTGPTSNEEINSKYQKVAKDIKSMFDMNSGLFGGTKGIDIGGHHYASYEDFMKGNYTYTDKDGNEKEVKGDIKGATKDFLKIARKSSEHALKNYLSKRLAGTVSDETIKNIEAGNGVFFGIDKNTGQYVANSAEGIQYKLQHMSEDRLKLLKSRFGDTTIEELKKGVNVKENLSKIAEKASGGRDSTLQEFAKDLNSKNSEMEKANTYLERIANSIESVNNTLKQIKKEENGSLF